MPARPTGKIELLALHVASGGTVRAWCKSHSVSERAAYDWASKPEFKARVRSLRERLVDRALGQLSRHASAAVAALAKIVKASGTEDSDRIRACRAILEHLVGIQSHTDLAARFAEMEERLADIATRKAGTP